MNRKQSDAQRSLLSTEEEQATKTLRFDKTFRIAVSGDVMLTELERLIVDTEDFQRLRGVRQLGTVCYVYPTALHTRFDHSLGTLEMADRMISSIRNNTSSSEEERNIEEVQRIIARLYALLHDVPHVPFGHTIEDELGLFQRHDENPERINRFLGPESSIGQLIINNLGEPTYDRFMAAYLWVDDADTDAATTVRRSADPKWEKLRPWLEMKHDDVFIHDIVSNTVCADLLDYLQRDSYFCNLCIGLEYRFLNFLYLHKLKDPSNSRRRVFIRLWKGRKNTPRRDTLTDLARLLEARYMLAERAYFHHTKIITGAMLGRALQEAHAAGELTEESLYEHSDDSLLRLLQRSKAEVAASLAKRLASRRLFKVIAVFDGPSFQEAQHHDHEVTFKDAALSILTDPEYRRAYEDELVEKIDVSPGSVLIYAPPSEMNFKLARMNVRWQGSDMHFCQIDDPVIRPRLAEILKAHKMLWGVWLVGDSSLSQERKSMLVEDFTLRFLLSQNEAGLNERRRKHVEALLDMRLISSGASFDGKLAKLSERKRAVAQEYLATSSDKRSHRVRLASAAKRIVEGTLG